MCNFFLFTLFFTFEAGNGSSCTINSSGRYAATAAVITPGSDMRRNSVVCCRGRGSTRRWQHSDLLGLYDSNRYYNITVRSRQLDTHALSAQFQHYYGQYPPSTLSGPCVSRDRSVRSATASRTSTLLVRSAFKQMKKYRLSYHTTQPCKMNGSLR